MNKKIILTESERKAIISDKEKAIIESFAKTFNKIKRIDENTINEYGDEDYDLEGRKQQYGINPEIEPADLEHDEISENDIEYDQAADEESTYFDIRDVLTTPIGGWDDMDTVLSVGKPKYSTFYCEFPLFFEYGERPNNLRELEQILLDRLGPMLYKKIEGMIVWNERSDINKKQDIIAILSYRL
jgi:hypothetical protein